MSDAVRIRRAENLADYVSCVELQKEVWGYSNMEDIAAQPLLMIADRFGGNLLIAEDASGHHVGFAFALPVWRADGVRFWWSHMTAVVEGYRKRGLGLRLKLRQREEALAAGIDRIEWTFDPLQAMNAYFNLCKVGVVVREYEDNVYGETSSPLHRGLPTDRFVAEWQLNAERVRQRRDLSRIPIINAGGGEPNLALAESTLLLEIPVDLPGLKAAGLDGAIQWQSRLRAACHHYFHRGYVTTDFIRVSEPEAKAMYVLDSVGA